MKLTIFISLMIPMMSWAYVSNFNNLINQNSEAQKELQHSIESTTVSNRAALGEDNDRKVVMDAVTYNAPTSRRALKFKKELSEHQAPSKKEMDRLAQEFKSSEREY